VRVGVGDGSPPHTQEPTGRAVIQPLVDTMFPTPKIVVLPLFVMIFGIGEESKYAIVATAVFYLVISTVASRG
jgi:ABC-type nitrate/sulfonate/bicarbonate transport system permease component